MKLYDPLSCDFEEETKKIRLSVQRIILQDIPECEIYESPTRQKSDGYQKIIINKLARHLHICLITRQFVQEPLRVPAGTYSN